MTSAIPFVFILAALGAGAFLVVAPTMTLVLAGVCFGGLAWTNSTRSVPLAMTTLVVTILGVFSGLLNAAFISPQMQAYTASLKWLAFIVPVVVAVAFSPTVRHLLMKPSGWSARLFLMFLAWSGIVLIARAGLDAELLFKWMSVVLMYAYAFAVIPGLLEQRFDARPLLHAFAIVAGIIGGLSLLILVFATGDALAMGRLQGVAFNALALAMFLSLGVITFAALGFNASNKLQSVLYFATSAVFVGLLALTGGRASVIGLFFGLVTLAAGAYRERRARVGLAVPLSIFAGIAVLIAATQLFGIRLESGLLREKGGEGTRLEIIRSAGSVVLDDPLTMATGAGFGVVRKTYYARLGIAEEAAVTERYQDVFWKLLHNSYLEALVETGIVGLTLLLGSILVGVLRMRATVRNLTARDRILGYALLAIVVAGSVESAFNSVLLAPGGALGIWFWTIIGTYSSWDSTH